MYSNSPLLQFSLSRDEMFDQLAKEEVPINIELLENVAVQFNNPNISDQERGQLNEILTQFQNRKDIYLYMESLLSTPGYEKAKFYLLMAFKNFVNSCWQIVPDEGREQLRNFICENAFKTEGYSKVLHTQLDLIVVAISKYEFPAIWPSFISDLYDISKTSTLNCDNALLILQYFCQEISDFADNSLTSARAGEMVNAFAPELPKVMEIIQTSLSTQDDILVKDGLLAFASLVKWVDPSIFFQSDILNQLCSTFLPNPDYSTDMLRILSGVISSNFIPEEFYPQLGVVFEVIITNLKPILEELGNDVVQNIPIRTLLANTLTSFLSNYQEVVETEQYAQPLLLLNEWLVTLTRLIPEDDISPLFEYWKTLCQRIHYEKNDPQSPLNALYHDMLPSLRRAMLHRIPSPFEFRENEGEDGIVVRRVYFLTHFGDLFYTAKSVMAVLTNLDSQDTVAALTEILTEVQSSGYSSIDLINSLNWGFGSIVGALNELNDRLFVSNFIQFSISLFDQATPDAMPNEEYFHRVKESTAMGACFACQQAHKFFYRDDELFSNVVKWMLSLLQFDDYDIKSLSIECLKSFCQTNRDQMTQKQNGNEMSLLEQILANFKSLYSSLSESSLICLFELTAALIRHVNSDEVRHQMFVITIQYLNEPLSQITPLQQIDQNTCHSLSLLAQCNAALASSLQNYVQYFLTKFETFINAYNTLTQGIVAAAQQPNLTHQQMIEIDAMKNACNSIINLVERTISYNNNPQITRENFFPVCMTVILDGFASTPPIAKTPKVLKLFDTFMVKLRQEFSEHSGLILSKLFNPVAEMLMQNYNAYSSIAHDFFNFMLRFTQTCTEVILGMSPEEINNFIETIKFGMSLADESISKLSHSILSELFCQIKLKLGGDPDSLNGFVATFAVPLFIFTFQIMTDKMHKTAFLEQTAIITQILKLDNISAVATPMFDQLSQLFPEQPPQMISDFLQNLITNVNNKRKMNELLKDFMINVKQLLPQDPDLLAIEREESRKRTEEIFKQISPDFQKQNDYL